MGTAAAGCRVDSGDVAGGPGRPRVKALAVLALVVAYNVYEARFPLRWCLWELVAAEEDLRE